MTIMCMCRLVGMQSRGKSIDNSHYGEVELLSSGAPHGQGLGAERMSRALLECSVATILEAVGSEW